MLNNKSILITGGTGSFGNAMLNRFANDQIQEITRLTLSKISNFKVTDDEIRDVVSKIERKTN